MDGFQLPQGQSHSEEAVYFLHMWLFVIEIKIMLYHTRQFQKHDVGKLTHFWPMFLFYTPENTIFRVYKILSVGQ